MKVEELLAADRFAAVLGARLVEAEPDRVIVEIQLTARHRDSAGRVSAGVLFALADCAMSLISNAAGTAVAVATHFTHSARPVGGPTIRAVARPELPVGDRPATWRISILAGATVVASFTGTTLRIDA